MVCQAKALRWFLPLALAGCGVAVAADSGSAGPARVTRDTLSALNRFESFTPADEFAPTSPADPDLGEQLLLTKKQRYRPFSINANWSTTWTSNAFYTPSNPSSDVLMSAGAELVALPHLGGNFFLEGTGSFRGYRYFRNPVLDFNSVDATAGVLKVFRELWDIGVYGRYEYSGLFNPRSGGELLHEHSLVVGARKMFQFSRAHALFVSAEADFTLGGEPEYALAHDFTFFAAHQVQWTRFVQTSFYYQMQALSFLEGGRADLRNNFGFSVNLQPLRWLTVYSTTWLGWNASTEAEYEFFVANLGGGVGASINF
ncbi:MAG: hypothetical protein SFU53_11085 [Terrimicrobiaceae bacterium]|nr:hypothetical protein [Terrimicrobiaceae bacterium]